MKTKSNMTVSKLQSEAVKELKKLKFTTYDETGTFDDLKVIGYGKAKTFLLDQIQKAVEETLNEVENNLSMAECIEPHETEEESQWFYHISEYTWLKLKDKLSIQSKRKIK